MLPIANIFGLRFYVFPVIALIAITCCLLLFICSRKYNNLFIEYVLKSLPWVAFFTVLIGKTLNILIRYMQGERKLSVLLNGFPFFGGLIGILAGLYIYCRINNLYFYELSDIFLSLLPLGQAIGRLGCYCNGCCYGKHYEGPFAVHYFVDGKFDTVYPTWFLESFFCICLFVIMFHISGRLYSGMYSAFYMLLYPVFRFIIEFYRGDTIRGVWGLLSTSQYISIIIFLFGIYTLYKAIYFKRYNSAIVKR